MYVSSPRIKKALKKTGDKGKAEQRQGSMSKSPEKETPLSSHEISNEEGKLALIKQQSFADGEYETVLKVMNTIAEVSSKRANEGFNEFNFSIGVLNCFLVAFILGGYPEHFWILYVLEGFFLFPIKLYQDWKSKPLNRVLFHLDYCWAMNTIGIVGFCLLLKVLPHGHALRKMLYLAFVGSTCGTLLGATMILSFVATLFHSQRQMAGLFIHVFPGMLAYTLMWNTDQIKEAWPNVFDLDYMEDVKFFPDRAMSFLPFQDLDSIFGCTIALYFMWFIPYVAWMLLIGLDLPRKVRKTKGKDGEPLPTEFDTVFHSTVRNGLTITIGRLWNRPKEVSKKQMANDDYEARDFLVYMAIHAVMGNIAVVVLGYLCFHYKWAHIALLLVLTTVCVFRGAKHYDYYVTEMYERAVKKAFSDILKESKSKKE